MASENSLALRLGRALIAIAWSDGTLDADERAGLSDIVFRLPDLRLDDWHELRRHMETAPTQEESERYLAELRSGLEREETVLPFLEELGAEDSPLSSADRALALQLHEELAARGQSSFLGWGRSIRDRLRGGARRVRDDFDSLRRGEADLRDQLPQHLDTTALLDRLGEKEFRRLCLLGALLGRVAHADHRLEDAELRSMEDSLQRTAGLSMEESKLVCEIGCQHALDSLDSYSLSREYFQLTNEEERIAALELLFALAHSDGELSAHEVEEIRRIRQGFLLSHRHFADARVRARHRAEKTD